jgi:hypothetical protein
VATGTLLAGYPLRSGLSRRGWPAPLTAIPALTILDLVLPEKRRERELLITSPDASPVAGTLPPATRTPRGIHEGPWPVVRVNSV